MDTPLRVAFTPGEPAGIGPDLAVALAQRRLPAEVVAVCDPDLLAARARALGLPLTVREAHFGRPPQPAPPGTLACLPVPLAAAAEPGRPDPANARCVLDTLDAAVAACREGHCSALVTGPVHKAMINDAGITFTGHTEYLAELTGAPRVVMMLVAGDLRVALATTHLPLREVPAAITPQRLEGVLRVLHADLQRRFGLPSPRIAVLGLNPHAGEDGHLGREERDVMEPVLERLRGEGLALDGPLPADTAFTPPALARCDVVLAMYHDQGLPVLKHAGFGRAVNVTLGLPMVRTSVDHGTALELAGTGRADTGSLEAALALALALARSEPP